MEIPEIKTRLMLSQVLEHYGLKPDKHLRLHCPFHEDKTPSMQVYYKTQTAYCFSSNCKTHGKAMDVIDFVMYKENCSKAEAIERCKQLTGAVVSSNEATSSRPAILGRMFSYFKNAVHNSKPSQDYLRQRGLDPVKLEIGYNTAQFHHGARRDEALINHCVSVGLLAPWGVNNRKPEEQAYKAFGKECICFALRNSLNQVTGLYFRSIINNTDAKHFYLKESSGLYPGYPRPETEKLIITESIIDAASLLQLEPVSQEYSLLAAYGTNRLNEEMKSAIQGLPDLTEIIFAFDNDDAGNKAALKYKEELQTLLPKVIFSKLLLPCKDVNETLQAHSDESIFIQLLQERTKDFSFSTETKAVAAVENKKAVTSLTPTAVEELDTSHPHKLIYNRDTAVYYVQGGLPTSSDHMKIMLVIENKATGMKARNRVDLYEDKQTEKLCKEVSEKLFLRKDLVEGDVYRLTDLLEQHIEARLQQQQPHEKAAPVLTVKERNELEGFARKPKLIKRLNELLGQSGIIGEERNRIFLLLVAISHKMPETLHALIQGSSGSGKTRLLKQVSDCMPQESVTKLTRLSDKVLYNFPEHYFVNRLLCLEDIDGLSEEAEFAFRELQSNGELNSATSIKLENGQITSGQKTVRGPIASLACTTHGEIYEDNMSRVFLIAVDESMEQTKRIIGYQNSLAAGVVNREDEEKAKQFIRKFISILHPFKVINPYANKVQLPEEAHKIRRLNDLFQNFVKMITVLNQYQRNKDEKGRLITQVEDLETAIHIMFESIVLKVDELDGSLRQFYESLKVYLRSQYKDKYESSSFSLREIRQALKVSKTQVFRYVNDLTRLEYLRQSSGYSNKGFSYQVCYWDNYQGLREKIKQNLSDQLKVLKPGTLRNTSGTLESA